FNAILIRFAIHISLQDQYCRNFINQLFILSFAFFHSRLGNRPGSDLGSEPFIHFDNRNIGISFAELPTETYHMLVRSGCSSVQLLWLTNDEGFYLFPGKVIGQEFPDPFGMVGGQWACNNLHAVGNSNSNSLGPIIKRHYSHVSAIFTKLQLNFRLALSDNRKISIHLIDINSKNESTYLLHQLLCSGNTNGPIFGTGNSVL